MYIVFKVPGNPQALKRHRTFSKGKFIGTYDPSKTDKMDFLAKCMEHKPGNPISGPITLRLSFSFIRPKSHYGTGKNADKLKISAPRQHTKKPDLDNLIKFVKDALNGVFWLDDSQINSVEAVKYYSDIPQVKIAIETP